MPAQAASRGRADVDGDHLCHASDPLRPRPPDSARQDPGRSRMVHIVAVLDVAFARATRPPVLAGVPAVSAALESVSRLLTRPPPLPTVRGPGRTRRRARSRTWWRCSCPTSTTPARHRRCRWPPTATCASCVLPGSGAPVIDAHRVGRVGPAVGREGHRHLDVGRPAGQPHRAAGVGGRRDLAPDGGDLAVGHPADLGPARAGAGQRRRARLRGEQQQGVTGLDAGRDLHREGGAVGVARRLADEADRRRWRWRRRRSPTVKVSCSVSSVSPTVVGHGQRDRVGAVGVVGVVDRRARCWSRRRRSPRPTSRCCRRGRWTSVRVEGAGEVGAGRG